MKKALKTVCREIHVGGQLVYYEGEEGYCFHDSETILDKGIMPSEKVLDFPVDCNTLTGSVNL